jgi:hypothetical protein
VASVGAIAIVLGASVASAGAAWTTPARVTPVEGSRMDSLHQLAAGVGTLHLVHPRIGPGRSDDRVMYQRSRSGGRRWSAERRLFRSTERLRHVVPNLALAARGRLVAVAWRVTGPTGTTLFLRLSRDGGATFGPRAVVARRARPAAIGVPAVTLGRGVLAVAWTDRGSGKVRVRRSLDAGRTLLATRVLGRTSLSIDCRRRVLDGLVGLDAAGTRLHVAWSSARREGCLATRVRSRSSGDRGATWRDARDVTTRTSYGWPEVQARGRVVLASLQLVAGRALVARSRDGGRTWSERVFEPPAGRTLGSGDVVLSGDGTAWLVSTDERYAGGSLSSTRIVARRSRDGGSTWGRSRVIVPERSRLRQAPNVALAGADPVVVFQAGPLSGRGPDLLVTRRVR